MELHPCLLFLTLPGIHRVYLSESIKPKAFLRTMNFVGYLLRAAHGRWGAEQTQVGGEPQWRSPALKFGNGLLFTWPRHMCGRGSLWAWRGRGPLAPRLSMLGSQNGYRHRHPLELMRGTPSPHRYAKRCGRGNAPQIWAMLTLQSPISNLVCLSTQLPFRCHTLTIEDSDSTELA